MKKFVLLDKSMTDAEIARALKTAAIKKHASETHPGTGTGQDVHGKWADKPEPGSDEFYRQRGYDLAGNAYPPQPEQSSEQLPADQPPEDSLDSYDYYFERGYDKYGRKPGDRWFNLGTPPADFYNASFDHPLWAGSVVDDLGVLNLADGRKITLDNDTPNDLALNKKLLEDFYDDPATRPFWDAIKGTDLLFMDAAPQGESLTLAGYFSPEGRHIVIYTEKHMIDPTMGYATLLGMRKAGAPNGEIYETLQDRGLMDDVRRSPEEIRGTMIHEFAHAVDFNHPGIPEGAQYQLPGPATGNDDPETNRWSLVDVDPMQVSGGIPSGPPSQLSRVARYIRDGFGFHSTMSKKQKKEWAYPGTTFHRKGPVAGITELFAESARYYVEDRNALKRVVRSTNTRDKKVWGEYWSRSRPAPEPIPDTILIDWVEGALNARTPEPVEKAAEKGGVDIDNLLEALEDLGMDWPDGVTADELAETLGVT